MAGKGGRTMKAQTGQKLAKGAARLLEAVLRMEANSASCGIIYQPKAPEELERYRKKA